MCLDSLSFQKQLDALVTRVMVTDTSIEFNSPTYSEELTDLLEVIESVPPGPDPPGELVIIIACAHGGESSALHTETLALPAHKFSRQSSLPISTAFEKKFIILLLFYRVGELERARVSKLF